MPTIIGPGGTNKNKNYEMFNIAEKFLGNNYGQGVPAAYYRTSLNERNKNLNYSIKNNNGKTAGFAFLKNFNNKERYLHLIAAKKGMGGILLKRIINNARKAGLKTIALEPVEDAIYFYLKHGFIHNNNKMILNLTKNHTTQLPPAIPHPIPNGNAIDLADGNCSIHCKNNNKREYCVSGFFGLPPLI
jgi:GNAT superfamily N-acetyltransferase